MWLGDKHDPVDPAHPVPAFSIIPTDREPGTG